MARIIYTGLVSNINGSIAGTTFQRNAYGHTIKKKPNIVNPNRPKQAQIKAYMQQISGAWLTVGATVRAGWAAYALSFPVASRLNPSSFLSGHAMFIRANLIRVAAGGSPLLSAPVMVSDSIPAPTIEVNRVGATLIYFNDFASSLMNMHVSCYLSGRVKETQLYDRTKTRFMGTFDPGVTDNINIAAPYTSQFGVLPATGDHVFLRTVYWSSVNGQVIDSNPVNIIVG